MWPRTFIAPLMVVLLPLVVIGQTTQLSPQAQEQIDAYRKLRDALKGTDRNAIRIARQHRALYEEIHDDAVFDELLTYRDEANPEFKKLVAQYVGGRSIWGKKSQSPRAIELMIALAHDPDPGVRYDAIYYGLSIVETKNDDVIRAMLDAGMMAEDYSWDLHGRIAYGLRSQPADRLAPFFEPYFKLVDTKDRTKALIAYGIYVDATKQEPSKPERFEDVSFIIRFRDRVPRKVDAKSIIDEFKKAAADAPVLDVWASEGIRDVVWGAAVVKGASNRRRIMDALQNSETILPGDWITPASDKLIATLKYGMDRDGQMAKQEKRQPGSPATQAVSYEQALRDLYVHLGQVYPNFKLKQIDWDKVGQELIPLSAKVKSHDEFGLLCVKLVARLRDSHAQLNDGAAKVPAAPLPQFDCGFACLMDDRDRPVVYYIDKNSEAAKAGVKIGMAVVSVNGTPANDALEQCEKLFSTYIGYSSDRALRYDAARFFMRQMTRGEPVKIVLEDPDGKQIGVDLPAAYGVRYLPRLPVPIEGINDSADVAWKKLDDNVGYIYVRRIRTGLEDSLDHALRELGEMHGLIIDVRGNSGGGFDTDRALLNFSSDGAKEATRPRYTGPIALLIDSRCISAGEGWASWFVANKRARLFGAATAGASSRKEEYTLSNGLYKVVIPVKAYTGFLDRPIELRGLEPDVPVGYSAKDLAEGKDTVLESAKRHLLESATMPRP